MTIFPNQKKAGKDILDAFDRKPYVLFSAQMQSGKTGTFIYVAKKMLKTKVQHVVIFSGNRETLLKQQTIDRVGDIDNVHVVWGTQLSNFVPFKEPTLYIWDESHYGQQYGQQVDLFLQKCGLNPKGGSQSNHFVLSVSATPFTEIFHIIHNDADKELVFMDNDDKYWSCQNMIDKGKIITYKDPFEKLAYVLDNFHKGYALIRGTDRIKGNSSFKNVQLLAKLKNIKFISLDMNNSFDLDDILSKPTSIPVIIFLRGTYLMGKSILHKQYVSFCFETSKYKKTDSLLQSFIGRFSGFNFNSNIIIYISSLFFKQLFIFNLMFLHHNSSPTKSTLFSRNIPSSLSIFS